MDCNVEAPELSLTESEDVAEVGVRPGEVVDAEAGRHVVAVETVAEVGKTNTVLKTTNCSKFLYILLNKFLSDQFFQLHSDGIE